MKRLSTTLIFVLILFSTSTAMAASQVSDSISEVEELFAKLDKPDSSGAAMIFVEDSAIATKLFAFDAPFAGQRKCFVHVTIDASSQQGLKNMPRQHENVKKKGLKKAFKPYYVMVYGGYGVPTGTVSDIGGLVEFPSTPAADIYKRGFALGLIGGLRTRGWLIEVAIEGRTTIPLTEQGQAFANLARIDTKKVSIEYASFDLFVGKSLMIGNKLSAFAGLSNGLVMKQLSAGTGEEPFNDEGYGMAVKLGFDWLAKSSWNLIIRPGIRYQLLTLGVSIPHDLVFHLGVGVGFVVTDF